jgi:hypothetical protein
MISDSINIPRSICGRITQAKPRRQLQTNNQTQSREPRHASLLEQSGGKWQAIGEIN